jgi:general secretion pathway protein D
LCHHSFLRSGQRASRRRTTTGRSPSIRRHSRSTPTTAPWQLVLDRAKLRAAQDHLARARRLEADNKPIRRCRTAIAAELNPSSGDIDDALRKVREQLRTKIIVRGEGKTELETLIDRSQNLGPAGFDLPNDVRLPASLVFRDASVREVYTVIARFANLNIVFEPTFRDDRITIDLSNVTLDQALAAVSSATHNFYQSHRAAHVTIVPDTAAKRREYEEEVSARST